jgi:miniconductance mechanosensitive channel
MIQEVVMNEYLTGLIFQFIRDELWASILGLIASIAVLILASIVLSLFLNHFLFKFLKKLISKTSTKWDDILLNNEFFQRLGLLLPLVLVYFSLDIVFGIEIAKAASATMTAAAEGEASVGSSELTFVEQFIAFLQRFVLSALVLATIRLIDTLVDNFHNVYLNFPMAKKTPIKGYLQLVKVFLYILGLVFVISILLDQDPWGIISSIGAMTAIILLVFKDSILGLVASIQLSGNNLVNVGDWIEVPAYGADGEVTDISLNQIKVQNWNKTISSIPTYALISGTFKNWRGMSESGGRRIKRSIIIDMNTVRFLDPKLMNSLKGITLLQNYFQEKKKEIAAHNQEFGIQEGDMINGRHLTNIGTFRAYIQQYLDKANFVKKDATLLVRQLAPSGEGLPIQLYFFANDTRWAYYESIQADVFDHLLAILPQFDLMVYQAPSGRDIKIGVQSLLSK